jgi:hypothetical protein
VRDKLVAEGDVVLTYALHALHQRGVADHLAFKAEPAAAGGAERLISVVDRVDVHGSLASISLLSVKSARRRAGLGRPSSSTTSPAFSTGLNEARTQARRIRWVFPEPMSTVPLSGRHVVGRDEACDTVLEGDQISRRHAEFRVDGPILAVRDLESRNGVYVNGVRRAGHGDLTGARLSPSGRASAVFRRK